MEEKKIKVAITHGDTNGVGYEVIFKAFEDPAMFELCTPIVYGSPKAAAYHAKAIGIDPQFTIINNAAEAKDGRLNLLTTFEEEVKIDLGMPTPEAGEAAKTALDRALKDWSEGLFDVLVTAPIAKNSIRSFDGHTSYITQHLITGQQEEDASRPHGLTILVSDNLRVALVTNNVSLKDVAETITKQKIVEKATIFHQSLRRDMRISSPRIAVLALNPRGGEDGVLGDEEQEFIRPAVEELAAQSIQAFGPYPVSRPGADALQGPHQHQRRQGRAPHRRSAPRPHCSCPRHLLQSGRTGPHGGRLHAPRHLRGHRHLAQPQGIRPAPRQPAAQALSREARRQREGALQRATREAP